MKKKINTFILSCLGLFIAYNAQSQIAISGGTTAAGSYTTLAAAINSLNNGGAFTAPVTIDVLAGHSELLTATISITATGTSGTPLIIQKSGTGANPILTAYAGTNTASSSTTDGMIALIGSDFVTIDAIDLQENVSNTTATTYMEYGYGLFKASPTDGANNNTIRNCTITLNRNNTSATMSNWLFQGSNGIALLSCTPTQTQTPLTITAVSGASSNNKFYANTIQNVNCGICLSGFAGAPPFTLCDTGNDIGGTTTVNGNKIINFGGGASAIYACAAVFVKDQWSVNISYNTVDNNVNGTGGINHPKTNRGIYLNGSIGASATINNNNITIRGGGTSSIDFDSAIDCEMSYMVANGNTININNNTISIEKSTVTSSVIAAIWFQSSSTTANINNNIIKNCWISNIYNAQIGVIFCDSNCKQDTLNINNNNISDVYFTGVVNLASMITVENSTTYMLNINGNTISGVVLNGFTSERYKAIYLYNSISTCINSISDNTFENISYLGGKPTGEFSLITTSVLNCTINGNTLLGNLTIPTSGKTNLINSKALYTIISNNNLTGNGIARTANSGVMHALYIDSDTLTISNNAINNVTLVGASSFVGIRNVSNAKVQNIANNTISNITGGSGTTYGISQESFSFVCNIENNIIKNITGGGVIYGISISNTASLNCFNNNISGLTTSGASTVYGIFHNLGTATNIYKNKIYTLSATASEGSATAIHIAGGTKVTIHNNFVGDIKAPAANAANAVNGINVAGGTTVNAYFNTVYLNATSTGALFGSSAINASTTPTLTLRNNIFVNTSIPNGTGLSVAYRRSSTTLTSYSSASNNNLFYATTVYTDGTNTDAGIATYKARVSTRDNYSFFENPPFLNTSTPANSDYLHVNTTVPTQIESGGVAIAGFDTDFDGDIRAGSSGYTGTAIQPDLGADEGSFIFGDFTKPVISAVTFSNHACGASTRTITANITDATGVPITGALMPRIYFRKNGGTYFSTPGSLSSGSAKSGTWTFTIDYSLLGGVTFGNRIYCYIIAQDIAPTPNIESSPSGVVATDVNTVTTAPATPLNYMPSVLLNGTYTVGAGGDFSTLSAAITAYNTSCLNGAVVFQLTDATYTNANCRILNNTYASATNTLTIYPTNAGTVISSNNSSTPTVSLNGARYVTIDGRVGGTGGFSTGSNLVVNNTSGTTNAILFINDAQNNTVKYVDVQSNNSNTSISSVGVILFGTTSEPLGNDNNTIDHCDVHNISGGNPVVAINAIGTGITGQENDNNVISNCNIYDYFHATNDYSGILINSGNSAWTFTNNHFYQTTSRTVTGTGFNRDIYLNNPTGNSTGSGFIVTNNYFGGDNASGSGTYVLTGTSAHQYCAIYCAVGTGVATSIQNNTITNIALTCGGTGASVMSGITTNGGNVNIGTITGNVIGAADVDASILPAITYTNNSMGTGRFIPIFAPVANNAALSTTNISNNTIGGISLNTVNANNGKVDFNAIGYNNGDITISNNIIGSTSTPKSIYCAAAVSSNTNTSRLVGILVSGGAVSSKNVTVSGNTIANLYSMHSSPGEPPITGTRGILVIGTLTGNINTSITNNVIRDLSTFSQATSGSGLSAAGGITLTAGSIGTCTVSGNSIYNINLLGAATTGNVQAVGIYSSSSPTGTALISRNNIHSFGISSNNPSATLTGMDIASGTWEISNNFIRLGIDGTGTAVSVPCTIIGIVKGYANSKIYNNNIYIGGSNINSTATTNTYALLRTSTASLDDWRNNILVNNRSNASTGGKHYAINLHSTAKLILNYNDYYGAGNGYVFGSTAFTGADVAAYTSNWVTGDTSSYNIDPVFINPTGNASAVNLHISTTIATIIEGKGTAIASVTVDYDGDSRSANTPTDIGADAGNFISLYCSGTPQTMTAISVDNVTPICVSGTKKLGLIGYSTLPGLAFQWKESSIAGGPYTTVTGGIGATASSYTTATTNTAKYYICEVTCTASMQSSTSSEILIDIVTPTVTSVTNGTRCGLGTVNLSATASVGAEIKWYSAATGGTALATGNNYTTPIISTSKTYYICANISTCESVRQAITATVTPADSIIISGNTTICSAGPGTVLTTSSSNTNYTYNWAPSSSLSTSTANSVVAFPSSATKYYVTATDLLTQCVATGSVTVFVNLTPNDPIIVDLLNSSACSNITKLEGTASGFNTIAQLGTGTLTTATNVNTPYSSNYEAVRINYLIRASELTALNYVAGPLTSIAFNVTTVGSPTSNPHGDLQKNYTIKLSHTNDVALTGAYGIPSGTTTTVYGPMDLPRPAMGWNTFAFTNNFVWDGVSNILIDICHENDPNSSCGICYNSNSTVQYSTTTYNSVYGKYTDNNTSCGVSNGAVINNGNRPNMKIGQIVTADYSWTPTTGLYTDAAATIPYTGGPAQKVWARPSTNTTYTVSATSGNGCPINGTDSKAVVADLRQVALTTATAVTASASCDDNGWTNYYDNGKIFFAVNWAPSGTLSPQNAIAKSAATVTLNLDATNSNCTNAGAPVYAMKRDWNLNSPTYTDPINVRFYYDPSEKTAVETAAGSGATFNWFRTNTAAFSPANNVTGKTTGVSDKTNLTGTTGTDMGVTYIQFDGISSPVFGGTGAAEGTATSTGGIKLNAKVFLNHISSGQMSPYLPDLQGLTPTTANFSLSDPYSVSPLNSSFVHLNNGAIQTTTTSVLSANDGTGNDIVDWVFLELRTGTSGSTTVAYTQSALLQADGDVVKAIDGVSAVEFPNATAGNYYVTLRHRNHLGFRTDGTQSLSSTASSLNFTNNSVTLYGSNPTITVGGVQVMVGGDANYDGEINSNDKSLWNADNGLSDDYQLISDFNLDGSIDSSDKSFWNANNGMSQDLD